MGNMLAAVFYGPHDLRLEEVSIPTAGEGEIIIRVRAAGICGTDVRIMVGSKKVAAPIIIGHELAGDVAEVGPDVTGVAVGDRVTIEPVIPCGRCPLCLKGRRNICLTRPTIGYDYDGAFAPFVKVPASAVAGGNVVPLPPEISYDEAALAEPVAACINGIDRSHIQTGTTVLILGAGPIGLIHLQLCRAAGASRIIVSEPDGERRQMALDLGADAVIDPRSEDVARRVREMTKGLGVEVAIVASGVPAAMETAVASLMKGGLLNIFAGSPPGSTLTLDPNVIHYGELTITGSSGHTAYHVHRAVDVLARRIVDAGKLITHRFALSEITQALEARKALEGLKHVVIMP